MGQFTTDNLNNFLAGGGESALCFYESNDGIKEESPVFLLNLQAQRRAGRPLAGPVGARPLKKNPRKDKNTFLLLGLEPGSVSAKKGENPLWSFLGIEPGSPSKASCMSERTAECRKYFSGRRRKHTVCYLIRKLQQHVAGGVESALCF